MLSKHNWSKNYVAVSHFANIGIGTLTLPILWCSV